MRFLWLTRDLPMRADGGAHIYSNGLIRSLCATGATGTLLSYAPNNAPNYHIPGLTIRAVPSPRRYRALSLFSSLHSNAYTLKGTQFTYLLKEELAKRPDVVVIDYVAMGWVLPIVQAALGMSENRPILVYIAHNYEPSVRRDLAKSQDNRFVGAALRLDAEKAARVDFRLVRAAALVVANTDEDKACYGKHFPDKRILTLTPAYDGEVQPTRIIDAQTPRRVIISGSFDWLAKQQALRRFIAEAELPFRHAGIDVLVVGRASQSFVEDMSGRSQICRLTGWVDDVRPFLLKGRIGIMPDDVGGGFKHKYLYYIFAGLPVASIRSQIVGLPIDIDRDMIARDSHKELVNAIVESIDDLSKLNGMRERCYESCATAFQWLDRGKLLRGAVDELLQARENVRST